MDELLQRLEKAKVGCYIGNFHLGTLCYVDDFTLLDSIADAMRSMLSICEEYTNKHAIEFNASKSKCIIFKPRSATIHIRPSFSIAGTLIDHVCSWPHLGNILSETEDDYECISARRILRQIITWTAHCLFR